MIPHRDLADDVREEVRLRVGLSPLYGSYLVMVSPPQNSLYLLGPVATTAFGFKKEPTPYVPSYSSTAS